MPPSPTSHEILAGQRVAACLAGAWRPSPPPLDLPLDHLEAIVPLLAAGGAAGLAWYRLRRTPAASSRIASELRQHHRLQTLQSASRAEAVRTLFARLRAVGIEPILIKGWSSALLYPEPGLRPSSDADLCVAPGQVELASKALSGAPLPCPVDLHAGVPDLPDRSWPEVFSRARLLEADGAPVRVLGPEDQLRLLCLHLVRHGLARPLWLCDLGAFLESLPPGFDWDLWQRGRPHLSAWASCVLGLACLLLGAKGPNIRVPHWVQDAALWCWGAGQTRPTLFPLVGLWHRLRHRGLGPSPGAGPVKAALHLGAGPDLHLNLLAQIASFFKRKVPHILTRPFCPRPVRGPFTLHRHG